MSLSVQTVVLMVLTAVAAQVTAFFLNNLEPVREFPGKNWLLLRMTVCLTLVPAMIMALLDDKVTGQARVGCWVAVGAIAIALFYDSEKLVSAVQTANARRRDPTTDGMATSVGYMPELRTKLLAEMNRQVEQRLKSAYGEQTPVNLEMQPDQEAVEGGKRESSVFLMPKPKQYVENFKDDRMRLAQSEETILDTFDDEAILGQLLILGAPGSGKTTALLKLAKDLLARAETNGIEIPYIFELSAWRDDQQDIASWLMAQLAFEHGIKETVSREWILNGQLLPLLDGLDELATDRRQKCIEKINEFVTGQLGRQVVVCCRTKVYEASGQKLTALNGALRIQPLEISQIQDYFERVNPEIWQALQDETGLGELLKPSEREESALLQIPLFLQILAIAYQPNKTLSSKSELLSAYTTHRLSLRMREEDRRLACKKELKIAWAYKTVDEEPGMKLTNRYLCWLACKLNESNIPNVLLIEQIQPSWLELKSQKRQYSWMVGLGSSLIISIIISPLINLPYNLSELITGLLFVPMVGLIISSWDIVEPVETFSFSCLSSQRISYRSLRLWIVGVLVFSFVGGLILSLMHSLIVGLVVALLACLVIAPLCGLFILVKIDFKVRESPNQGIIASAKNSLIIACITFPILIAMLFLISSLLPSKVTSPYIITGGILIALVCGFMTGGVPVVQHATLRFLLHRQGHIPHNYAKFLKYTTERRLTQQIGGSFRFIHRELLDHFAAMDADSSNTSQ